MTVRLQSHDSNFHQEKEEALMAVLDHNDNHVSWLAHKDIAQNEAVLSVLRGTMLVLAGVVGVSLSIALDPIVNIFA
ncbi:hypothetical protein HY29_07710 [Hyphomonas beringensis]|uniref:Uncharacterized protein n=2 Tax=Hyphomonas beringensis TaxID=1280946 RepID=A0A062UFC2_9PROT|nr:hypothetical protein HY29_07710 [Hyphomonas beringensis]